MHHRVTQIVTLPDSYPNDPAVPIEDAVAETYPWAVQRPGGQWCHLQYFGDPEPNVDRPDGHTYYCEDDRHPIVVNPNTFFENPQTITVDYQEGTVATITAVTRPSPGNDSWTGNYRRRGDAVGRTVRLEAVAF